MTNYLRWAFRQLFLIYFQPIRFCREADLLTKGNTSTLKIRLFQSVSRLVDLIPISLFVVIGLNIIIGCICVSIIGSFHWKNSIIYCLSLLLASYFLSIGLGLTGEVYGGIRAAIACSMVLGITGAVVAGFVSGVFPRGFVGVAFGIPLGQAIGILFIIRGSNRYKEFSDYILMTLMSFFTFLIYSQEYGFYLGITCGIINNVFLLLFYFGFPIYLIEVLLSTICILVVAIWPHAVSKIWKIYPLYWDETIRLKLPFISTFLIKLAKIDREHGIGQIIFVAAERPLQKHAALTALAELTVDALQLKSLGEISNYQKGTTTLRLERVRNVAFHGGTNSTPAMVAVGIEGQLYPAELLAPEFNEPLPRFDRVATQVGQFYELRNTFRKVEALNRALGELESLQKSLVVARGKYVLRLLQAANQWRDIIKAEREALAATAEQNREIPNPFVYGNPVTEADYNVFAGRADVVAKIESEILNTRQAPTLLLFGPRRMGKSSILNQLPRLLGPDFAVAMVDCQAPEVREGVGNFLWFVANEVAESVKRRRIPVEPLPASVLETSPFTAFTDWLAKLEATLPEGTRILLCLDEYERLQATLDAGWGADLLDFLRNTIQHRSKFVVMFTGANKVSELGPAWTDRFISVRSVRVSFLSREEITPLFTHPIPEFDMTYAEGALDAVLTQTNGQPFLSQALGFELVQYLNEHHRKQATVADVEVAVGRVIENADAYFANVWSDAREEGQAILSAIAAGKPVPEHPRAMRWLKEHDVLNADGKFYVPMVERWVRERA